MDEALAAQAGGAGRVELCAALELGGLTPSVGAMLEASRRLAIPFVAMVRPRAGGFVYTAAERVVMARDVELALAAGAGGVVFGILDESGRVDARRARRLLAHAGRAETVFHKAFDEVTDQLDALDALIDLGITRVLTSGGRATALEGAANLKRLVEHADGRIEILAGGGIRSWNVEQVVASSGVRQVHMRIATESHP